MPDITRSYRCHSCGQGWQLHKTDEFNSEPPRYCPICGAESLKRSSNVMGTDEASCFVGYDKQLLALMLGEWLIFAKRTDPNVKLPARFIDYLKQELD